MTHAKRIRTRKSDSGTTRREEIHTRLHSAEHLGKLFDRQGLLRSGNPKEQPWCSYIDNEYGHLVSIFDSQRASGLILEILKDILYPTIPEMIYAGDAEARDPNEVGMEILMSRQEVWFKYYFEASGLLHKHFDGILQDAMMRLVEEVLEVIIPELDGQGGFSLTKERRKYLRDSRHFLETCHQGWQSPKQRRAARLKSLKSGRSIKRLRRPKESGWFKNTAEFKVALRETLDLSSGRPREIWVLTKLNEHPLRQRPESRKTGGGTLDGPRKTLRGWLKAAGLFNLSAAVEWHERLKRVEDELAAPVVIRRKSGTDPVIGLTVSYRGSDPASGKKEMFTRSVQRSFDPQKNEFEVDGPTARAALATGGFEPAARNAQKRIKIDGK